jgi:hypothetical protein
VALRRNYCANIDNHIGNHGLFPNSRIDYQKKQTDQHNCENIYSLDNNVSCYEHRSWYSCRSRIVQFTG